MAFVSESLRPVAEGKVQITVGATAVKPFTDTLAAQRAGYRGREWRQCPEKQPRHSCCVTNPTKLGAGHCRYDNNQGTAVASRFPPTLAPGHCTIAPSQGGFTIAHPALSRYGVQLSFLCGCLTLHQNHVGAATARCFDTLHVGLQPGCAQREGCVHLHAAHRCPCTISSPSGLITGLLHRTGT